MQAGGEPIVVHVGPRRNDDGDVWGVVGTVVPALEGDGRSSARAAFLRHLNRELRSPMTAILGYAELLDGETPPDEVSEVRDVIVRAGERLLGALDDLLDLTVLDDDDLTSRPAPVDLGAMVTSIVESYRTAADARRIGLEAVCKVSTPLLLLDGSLFERAARHLVGSAVASTMSDQVSVRLYDSGPDTVDFAVIGMPPSASAMGIGPDLVRQIASAMGGTSSRLEGDEPGWVLTLPRRSAPVVDLEGAPSGGGEAVAMAEAEPPR
ncbi:sensor histidine kinase, partial [Rubrivirga sp.]|uniref:sensor histidine kinase n=1 Tax=Rubrivirga sp. TaxID=1885344 RepID=UPI003C731FD4